MIGEGLGMLDVHLHAGQCPKPAGRPFPVSLPVCCKLFVFVPPKSRSVLFQDPRKSRLETISIAVAPAGSMRRAPF
jgi:hypothetical protein